MNMCLEHGVKYDGVDTLMCPRCENDICEQYDPLHEAIKLKAVITVGISASGKSTLAKEYVEKGYTEVNRDWIRFNVVKPGADWRTYKFNKTNEAEVDRIQGQMVMEAWGNCKNVIISDTNLNANTRHKMIESLKDLGYDVEIVAVPVTLAEAYKRDAFRENGVGQAVIYRQWQNWNEFIGRPTYKPNVKLCGAIIVDIDGTIAEMYGRGPFDWKRVGEDKARWFVIDMVNNYQRQGFEIIVVSGRSDVCRNETENWLAEKGVKYSELHMRRADDFRKDDAVKEEIFWTKLSDRYNIHAVIDDRPQVVRLWWDLCIPNVICVGNPYLEF